MTIVMGLDQHRAQITYDLLDGETGEVRGGRICPGDRESVRDVLRRFAGRRIEAALEASAPIVEAGRPHSCVDCGQYVALPPEMSKHAPVENVISSLASQQASAATSEGSPVRPSGIREVM
jgi:hypothetical protein